MGKKILKIVAWCLLILVALAVIGHHNEGASAGKGPRPATATPDTSTEAVASAAVEAPLPEFSASSLQNAYDENTVAADEIYKNKRFKVRGVIGEISTNIFGIPYVTLKTTGNPYMQPQFAFDDSAATKYEVAQLKRGKSIVLVCVGAGDVIKTPMSKDCKISH